MKGENAMKRIRLLCLFLSIVLLYSTLFGCQKRGTADDAEQTPQGPAWSARFTDGSVIDLMAGVTAQEPTTTANSLTAGNVAMTDFSVRLLQACLQNGQNTLIAPLSVWQAVGMIANGANGATKTQIEQTMGMTVEEINLYTYLYNDTYANGKCLTSANAMWLADSEEFVVNPAFLQANADYYGADAFRVAQGDFTRLINEWVNEKTAGKIPTMQESQPDGPTWLYLVNALYFEAEWAGDRPWENVESGTFTREDGTTETVQMMQAEQANVFQYKGTTGFVKSYKSCPYDFVALLPERGTTIADYVAGLTGAELRAMLSAVSYSGTVYLPQFDTSYKTDLADALSAMGMSNAFTSAADFSGIGRFGPRDTHEISRVTHKTTLSVNEYGTVASAATAIEMADGISFETHFDRPFVYLIVNRMTKTPVFIGTLMNVSDH